MTNSEVLKKALSKACQNGWYIGGNKVMGVDFTPGLFTFSVSFSLDKAFGTLPDLELTKDGILFHHDFAKAFWGDGDMFVDSDKTYRWKENEKVTVGSTLPRWKFQLQWMVIEENPVKYLEKYL